MQIHSIKPIVSIGLLGAAALSLINCDQSGVLNNSENNKTRLSKVFVISDSIGTGYGKATPFPNRIREIVDVEVISDSVNGRQTSGGLAVIKKQLELHKPSHLLVLLGTNDVTFGTVETAISNLQDIVNTANDSGVIAVVGTLPPYLRSGQGNDFASCISVGIRDLNGANIADIQNTIGDGSTTIADGVHPNNNGQQIIAEVFLKHL